MKVEQNCKILEAVQLPSGAYSFTVESMGVAGEISGPGQFVHIKCGEGQLLRRPISICDWSAEADTLRLVFEARGEGTLWLSQRREGDCLDILGPLGHGFDMTAGRYLLVGGGIGAPPMLGCARHSGGASTAILGFRSKGHAMLLDEFRAACSGGVRVATDDGSLGHHGFVDALVREELEGDGDYTAVLACGPRPMLRSVARVAEEFGIPCQVSMEERMGCGVGACLVCACRTREGRYRHVCKDGPVFDAGEVDWDG